MISIYFNGPLIRLTWFLWVSFSLSGPLSGLLSSTARGLGVWACLGLLGPSRGLFLVFERFWASLGAFGFLLASLWESCIYSWFNYLSSSLFKGMNSWAFNVYLTTWDLAIEVELDDAFIFFYVIFKFRRIHQLWHSRIWFFSFCLFFCSSLFSVAVVNIQGG